MTAEERMRERAARAITPVITQGNAAQQIYNSALVWAEQCIRALPLEGDQGEPAKDQRGAAAPDTADHGRVNSVEAMNAEAETTQSAPHHHSRTEQVDRNLTPENQARIEDTFQGLVSQHFDCHYNGEPSKCDKDCAQLGYCKRRTSEPAPAREPGALRLVRYGLNEYEEGKPVLSPIDNGYWTPWHIAKEELDRLRAEAENFHMAYRMKCDEETKAQTVEIDRLRAENAAWSECWKVVREMCGDPLDSPNKPLAMAATVAILHQSCADLREQLQGGVVVPRETVAAAARKLRLVASIYTGDKESRRLADELLAAAKETKHG